MCTPCQVLDMDLLFWCESYAVLPGAFILCLWP